MSRWRHTLTQQPKCLLKRLRPRSKNCDSATSNKSNAQDEVLNEEVIEQTKDRWAVSKQISARFSEIPPEWAGAPRIWAIACEIGEVEAFNSLLKKHGFSDMQLPFTASTLSSYLEDDRLVRNFMSKQHLVMSKLINLDESDIPNKHFVIDNAEDTFDFQEQIGSGGCGAVYKATQKKRETIYAIKRLRRHSIKEQTSDQMADFLNEIKIMVRLDTIPARHCHLVNFHGCYTDQSHIGLIMSPVAERNLLEYLNDLNAKPTEEAECTIRSMYGCLVSVVKWLHSHNVKHKDIKSTNILVRHDRIFLIDFGISRIYETKEKTNTKGLSPFTADYASREVFQGDWKGLASDIWSLGRTFVDICGALNGMSPENIVNILQTTGSGNKIACFNAKGLSSLLEQLKDVEPSAENRIVECIESMMRKKPGDRIKDDVLMNRILSAGHQFCGKCCR